MRVVQAPRASSILYNVLTSQAQQHPWLLPANICPIVPVTFLKAGVPFEFIDISDTTLHMDHEQTRARLAEGEYGGLLYAHTYGDPTTPVEWFRLIKDRYPDVLVMDDRCLCRPDLEPPPDVPADVVLYSTGYAKILDLGFGGYAFIDDSIAYREADLPFDEEASKAIDLDYKKAVHDGAPFAYRDSDWLQTRADLPSWESYAGSIAAGLPAALEQREAINAVYARTLPAEIQLDEAYQTWRFNIRVKNPRGVLEAIFADGLFASSHYASLAGIMAAGSAPRAETLAAGVVNLFNDHHFDVDRARRVCRIVAKNLD